MLVGSPIFYYPSNFNLMVKMMEVIEVDFPDSVNISDECKDFIKSLLRKEPLDRLGSLSGKKEIFRHPWFRGFDFEGLRLRTLKVPWVPKPSFLLGI